MAKFVDIVNLGFSVLLLCMLKFSYDNEWECFWFFLFWQAFSVRFFDRKKLFVHNSSNLSMVKLTFWHDFYFLSTIFTFWARFFIRLASDLQNFVKKLILRFKWWTKNLDKTRKLHLNSNVMHFFALIFQLAPSCIKFCTFLHSGASPLVQKSAKFNALWH